MSPPGSPRDQRRFPRYAAQIPVMLHRHGTDLTITTGDVSRHGAFLRTDENLPARQLVQLRFRCAGFGDVDAMCMVARVVGRDHPLGRGVGVDMFALSKEAKNTWERFIAELRTRSELQEPGAPTAAPAPSARPATTAAGGFPPGELVLPRTTTPFGRVSPLALGAAMAPPPPAGAPPAAAGPAAANALDEHGRASAPGSVVMMRFPDTAALRVFLSTDLERGGTFLQTPLVKEVGQKVDLVMVHPETDDEFHLEGTVIRRVITGPAEGRGLGIFFKALTPTMRDSLEDFALGGVEIVDLASVVTDRQLELEAAVAREPDSAEALEALGSYLLDEANDLGGALTALTRALVLGPSVVSIHASLARAYRRIGDQVKVRAHERVAEALMLMQDRMRVRMGVGDAPEAR